MKTTTCPACCGEAVVDYLEVNAECVTCGHRFRTEKGQEFDRNVKVLSDAITAPVRWLLTRLSRKP